jgi:PAS domain S-box-containing protein
MVRVLRPYHYLTVAKEDRNDPRLVRERVKCGKPNRQGHIVLVNAKTEAMFGYARAELIGRPLEILVPERMQDVHARHRAGYSLDPHVRPMGQGLDLTGRGISGNEFPVEISLSFAETEGERLFMAFVTDITQRKRVEEAAQRAEALHSVALLANAAAHEINNR